MVVSNDIMAVVDAPFPETDMGQRLAELRQMLDAFSEGGQLSVSEHPYDKPPDTHLARVDPVSLEFWSIRVTDPEETAGVRVFGAFADKDTFVALTWEFREHIQLFDEEVKAVKEAWEDLFGSEPPLSGERLDEYLSNYYTP